MLDSWDGLSDFAVCLVLGPSQSMKSANKQETKYEHHQPDHSLGNVAGGGVGGAILMAIVGIIKNKMAKN